MNFFNRILLLAFVLLFSGTVLAQGVNLLAGWAGNGATGAGSEPNKFGWECTHFNEEIGWVVANGGAAVRYMDNQGYLPGDRLLFVRWDGVGNAASVYSYPVTLEAGKVYQFSLDYTRHSNSTTGFVIGVNSARDNSGEALATGIFHPATQNFRTASFRIAPLETKEYYVTVGATASGMLGSIARLSMIETAPQFGVDVTSLRLNHFTPQHTFRVYSNGSNDAITLTAPADILLQPTSLPALGGNVTVSSPNKVDATGVITVSQGSDQAQISYVSDYPADFFPSGGIDTLTVDGAWCWFADPRAIYHKGTKEQTYFSWVTKEGHIEVASYNHASGEYNQHRVFERFQEDDHANPSLLIRNDGRLIIFVAAHFGAKIHRLISTNPEDITSWGTDYEFSNTVTYPYPFQVGDSICVFYRGGSDWHPRLSVSTDNGQTFDDGRLLISGGGQRPYTRYAQGSDGSIHIAVTTGHPRNEPANKVHYARLKDNKIYRANGTMIKDVSTGPVDLSQLEVVYDGTSYGKGWIWDITLEPGTGYPIMVYASFPTDTDHRYHYGRWNGTNWVNTQITEAGRWFPQTPAGAGEPEPNYSGGIILDYDNPSVVYLSKEVNGVFEIFRYTTADKGATWSPKALTWNTPAHLLNVRPVVPRHHKEGFFDVIWMRGTYVFYGSQQYNTAVVFPEVENRTTLEEMGLNFTEIDLLTGDSKSLYVKSWKPFLGNTKNITWTTSNASVATVSANGLVTAIREGQTEIKAVSVDGVEAVCVVNVKAPDYYFDFGTPSSPVATGAVGVFENTLWNEANGYGWVTAVASRDRGANWDNEVRDFCMHGNPAIFKVKVSGKAYEVQLKQGDMSYMHDAMRVKVNGKTVLDNITSNSGEVKSSHFPVEAADGMLEFEFSKHGNDANWVVNSIKMLEQTNTSVESTKAISLTNFQYPETKVKLFDLSGRILLDKTLEGFSIHTFMSNQQLNKGMYIMQLELNGNKLTLKYILNG